MKNAEIGWELLQPETKIPKKYIERNVNSDIGGKWKQDRVTLLVNCKLWNISFKGILH